MSAVQGIVLLVRFLSELAALAAFGVWGVDAAGLAAAFAIAAIGCAVLVRYLGEEPGATPAA